VSNLHIYTAAHQPATRYEVLDFDPPLFLENKPRALVRCWNCNRLRWASRCTVQVYYDAHRFAGVDRNCKKAKR